MDKDIFFFQRKVHTVKRTKLDATGDFHSSSKSALEASYIVSFQIAKAKKSHTIGEELILPCTKAIVRLMIGTDAERKLNIVLSFLCPITLCSVEYWIFLRILRIRLWERLKNPPQDGFAYNWMNPQMLLHVLNSLFLFGATINWILKLNFYFVNNLTCKHMESIFTIK